MTVEPPEYEKDDVSVADEYSVEPSELDDEQENQETLPGKQKELAADETKLVKRSKWMVFVVLVLAAAAVGTLTYMFVADDEQDDFETDFNSFAREVLETSRRNAASSFNELENLATTLTSSAMTLNQTWPFVTIPDYERRAAGARKAASLSGVGVVVRVPEDQAGAYAQFVVANPEWYSKDWEAFDGTQGNELAAPPVLFTPFEGTTPFMQDDYALVTCRYSPPLPVEDTWIHSMDQMSIPITRSNWLAMLGAGQAIFGESIDVESELFEETEESEAETFIFQPLFDSFEADANVVGVVTGGLPWRTFMTNLLPDSVATIVVVLDDSCTRSTTYEVNGNDARFVGFGDFHDRGYSDLVQSIRFNQDGDKSPCNYTLNVYPTKALEDSYTSSKPIVYTIIVLLVFVFTATVFVSYDCMVSRRQKKVMQTAERTTKIVSAMFPEQVQERIFEEVENQDKETNDKKAIFRNKSQMRDIIAGGAGQDVAAGGSRPIADLFPETTIMFADVVGFTAWSSTRDPTQVFTLLESIFTKFDELAKARKVFKVETVGDCYVAVAGLPEPMRHHAVTMTRFARDCLFAFQQLIVHLELTLGPDTADLGIRIGLHSGPTTAGVLRGERSRFQLFGDTVNMASRMESTGGKNKIQISSATAELLRQAGKDSCLVPRDDLVNAKGKGEVNTFWIAVADGARSVNGSIGGLSMISSTNDHSSCDDESMKEKMRVLQEKQKMERLVDWNVEVFVRLLKSIEAHRSAHGTLRDSTKKIRELERHQSTLTTTTFEQLEDTILLPHNDKKAEAKSPVDPLSITLSEVVVKQLRLYVQAIAAMYRANAFHNFEHASHVAMSTQKMLLRIHVPDIIEQRNDHDSSGSEKLHDYTYGITSDPLTSFAIILSALIHDVDHPGVTNAQLIKEKSPIADAYKNVSVAEQNSMDLAWSLLMDEAYTDLRQAIYCNFEEFHRFRSLLVTAVMATDVMDPVLGAKRKDRWEQAFVEKVSLTDQDVADRRATIVIEHLIQASDVCHTMQHWTIYNKWNDRLFREVYQAYLDGRTNRDPSETWYEGELGFFDHYVIPLAKKLEECGVFGVTSAEFLDYAKKNREEWAVRGTQLIKDRMQGLSRSIEMP